MRARTRLPPPAAEDVPLHPLQRRRQTLRSASSGPPSACTVRAAASAITPLAIASSVRWEPATPSRLNPQPVPAGGVSILSDAKGYHSKCHNSTFIKSCAPARTCGPAAHVRACVSAQRAPPSAPPLAHGPSPRSPPPARGRMADFVVDGVGLAGYLPASSTSRDGALPAPFPSPL